MSGKAVRETLGFIGVIVSMVFVGMEMRLNTQAIQATARNEMASGSREWLMEMSASPALSSAARRWAEGEELNADLVFMVELSVNALLRNAENVFLQVEGGTVDESALVSYGFTSSGFYQSPNFPEYWAGKRENYHPAFVTAFEEGIGLRM